MADAHHAPSDDSSVEHHAHPPVPTVHDEAADTPKWVPLVGIVLLGSVLVWGLFRMRMSEESAPHLVGDEAADATAAAPTPAPLEAVPAE